MCLFQKNVSILGSWNTVSHGDTTVDAVAYITSIKCAVHCNKRSNAWMIVQNGDQLSFHRKESRGVQLCFRRQSLS